MTSTIQALLGILGALGIMIVFLSSFLITNTLSALLNQHLSHIGIMKLVGARTFQVMIMYMTLVLIFGSIAVFITVPLGGVAAYALAMKIANEMNFSLQGYRVVPFAMVLQVIIAVGVPLTAGFFPVKSGSRITVLEAISGYRPSQAPGKESWMDRFFVRNRWIPRPFLISLRNTFRRKWRLALTLFTLTLGGAIFIAVFNVQASLDQYIKQIGNYFLADVNLSFERAYRINEIRQHAMMVPGVEHVEGWAFASGEITREDGTVIDNIQLMAPPADSNLIRPILIQGRWIYPDDRNAIAVNEAILTDLPDLRTGESLKLKISGSEEDWVVVGIFKFVGRDDKVGYITYDRLSAILGETNKAYTYRIVTREHARTYQEKLGKQIDKHFRDLGFEVSEVDTGLSTLEAAAEGLGILINFLLIMAALTALVGSIGLMGTMGMNVLERTREIGVMRAIGAVDGAIMKSVILEGLIIGMISWLIGALLSFPISAFLSDIISSAIFQTPMGLALTPNGFIIWLVLVIIFSALASVLPALKAARLTIREVLAYE